MNMENIYAGLDIGTTKVCVIVASLNENNYINILGIGNSKSEGVTRGVITHINKTIESISAAAHEAERQSGLKIQSVVAGIAGDHVQCLQTRGVVAISGKNQVITDADVKRLIDDTKKSRAAFGQKNHPRDPAGIHRRRSGWRVRTGRHVGRAS